MKRFIAFIIVTFFLLSTSIPFALADDYTTHPASYNFWAYFLHQKARDWDGLSFSLGPISFDLPTLACRQSGFLCSKSSDNWHHADFVNPNSFHTGPTGKSYVMCTCKYCGDEFPYFEDDLQQDYQTYLHDSGLDNGLAVTAQGGFTYRPTLDDVQYLQAYHYYHVLINKLSNPPVTLPNRASVYNGGDWVDYRSDLTVSRNYTGSTPFGSEGITRIKFYAPVSGTYSIDAGTIVFDDGFVTLSDGSSTSFQGFVGVSKSWVCKSSDLIDFSWGLSSVSNLPDRTYNGRFVIPSFTVVPSQDVSNPSVPSTITINNNTYPVIDIDFNSRTVHVTDDRTIIYDDDHITIKEGDTVIQTINYIIENDDPGTDPGNGDDSSTPTDPGTVDPGDASGSGGSGCCEQCALLLRQVNSYLLQIQTLVDQINDKLGPESDNYMEGIYNLLVEINTGLDNLPTEPHKDYEAKLNTITNQLANIWGDLDTIKTSLSAVQTNTVLASGDFRQYGSGDFDQNPVG